MSPRTYTFLIVAVTVLTAGQVKTNAGVVLNSDGFVSSYTTADDTYYFYHATHNQLSASGHLETFDETDAINLAGELSTDIKSFSEAATNVTYLFNYDLATNAINAATIHQFSNATWKVNESFETNTDQLQNGSRLVIYASTEASTGGTVPEPSTAITMGLLSLVGFVGNRRRCRQGSAA